MEEYKAYCLKCKQKQVISEAKEGQFKNGTPVMKGKCSVCGSGLNMIMKRKKKDA